jgi:hypothetical protein
MTMGGILTLRAVLFDVIENRQSLCLDNDEDRMELVNTLERPLLRFLSDYRHQVIEEASIAVLTMDDNL